MFYHTPCFETASQIQEDGDNSVNMKPNKIFQE